MPTARNVIAAAAAVLFIPWTSNPAAAGSAPLIPRTSNLTFTISTNDPQMTMIQNICDQLIHLGSDQTQRLPQIEGLFRANFDIPFLSNFVLGVYSRQLNQDQKNEFADLFTEFVPQIINEKFEGYIGGASSFKVTGKGIDPSSGEIVILSQIIRSSQNQSIPVNWYLSDANEIKIRDVKIGELSLRGNGRNVVYDQIAKNGGNPPAILAVLRDLLHKEPPLPHKTSDMTRNPLRHERAPA